MKRIWLEVCPQKRSAKPWKVTKDGETVGECATQADAIYLARSLALRWIKEGRTASLKIKRPDGRIRDERTYPRGSDPRRSKG